MCFMSSSAQKYIFCGKMMQKNDKRRMFIEKVIYFCPDIDSNFKHLLWILPFIE